MGVRIVQFYYTNGQYSIGIANFEKVTIHYTKTIAAISHFVKERIEGDGVVHDLFNH